MDFRVEVPGTYVLVDHSIFRAFNKGALGLLRVTGPENHTIYSGREIDEVYLGEHPAGPMRPRMRGRGDGGPCARRGDLPRRLRGLPPA